MLELLADDQLAADALEVEPDELAAEVLDDGLDEHPAISAAAAASATPPAAMRARLSLDMVLSLLCGERPSSRYALTRSGSAEAERNP